MALCQHIFVLFLLRILLLKEKKKKNLNRLNYCMIKSEFLWRIASIHSHIRCSKPYSFSPPVLGQYLPIAKCGNQHEGILLACLLCSRAASIHDLLLSSSLLPRAALTCAPECDFLGCCGSGIPLGHGWILWGCAFILAPQVMQNPLLKQKFVISCLTWPGCQICVLQ